jgi:hypothetical protein
MIRPWPANQAVGQSDPLFTVLSNKQFVRSAPKNQLTVIAQVRCSFDLASLAWLCEPVNTCLSTKRNA